MSRITEEATRPEELALLQNVLYFLKQSGCDLKEISLPSVLALEFY